MSMSDLGWHMFRIKSVCVHEHYGHAQSVPVLGPGNLVTLLSLPVATCVCPLENKSVNLAHLAASLIWLFQPLFIPSILPNAYSCGSLSEKTFWKRRAMDPTNSIWEGRTP